MSSIKDHVKTNHHVPDVSDLTRVMSPHSSQPPSPAAQGSAERGQAVVQCGGPQVKVGWLVSLSPMNTSHKLCHKYIYISIIYTKIIVGFQFTFPNSTHTHI